MGHPFLAGGHCAPHRTALRDISLLYASTFIVLAGASVSPTLPQIAEAFGDTPAATFWVQWILTLPATVSLLSAPLVGRTMDRRGGARLLSASVALYMLAGAIPRWRDRWSRFW